MRLFHPWKQCPVKEAKPVIDETGSGNLFGTPFPAKGEGILGVGQNPV
jgi:hypothetical protein